MKAQNILSIVLFLLSLPGNFNARLPHNTPLMSPFLPSFHFSTLWVTNAPLIDVDWTQIQNELAAKIEASVDTNAREALPNSYYGIRFLTSDGTWRRHNGVAIADNALLSSDHILPSDVKPENVVQIQLTSSNGHMQDIYTEDGFIVQPEEGFTLIVFSENIIPEENIALLGDADDLNIGTLVQQAVVIGAEAGIYPTFIRDQFIAQGYTGQQYPALRVFPDKTIVGDSGDPLYINGVVYGINNAGDGICGAITDPDAVYQTVHMLTETLKAPQVGERENMEVNDGSETGSSSDETEIITPEDFQDTIENMGRQFIISPKEFGIESEIIMD